MPHAESVRVGPDGCAVPTENLARVLKSFLEDWNRTRPSTGGHRTGNGNQTESVYVRGIAWLSLESGVPEWSIRIITSCRYRTTELRTAEALVAGALERPDLFYDGNPPTLPVVPNPTAPKADRLACCGGSEVPPALVAV